MHGRAVADADADAKYVLFWVLSDFFGPVMKAMNFRVLFFCDLAAISSVTQINELTHGKKVAQRVQHILIAYWMGKKTHKMP